MALESAGQEIANIRNVILGTHDEEHDECLALFKDAGFEIKLNFRANEIPIQPDGIIWAHRKPAEREQEGQHKAIYDFS